MGLQVRYLELTENLLQEREISASLFSGPDRDGTWKQRLKDRDISDRRTE